MPNEAPDLPVVEIAVPDDINVRNLMVLMARMEALAEDREPHVVSGRVRECAALGQRLEKIGFGSIGDLGVLSAAQGRGCEVAIIAKRILKRVGPIIEEEVGRLYEDRD